MKVCNMYLTAHVMAPFLSFGKGDGKLAKNQITVCQDCCHCLKSVLSRIVNLFYPSVYVSKLMDCQIINPCTYSKYVDSVKVKLLPSAFF
jgi:hypothetical protein